MKFKSLFTSFVVLLFLSISIVHTFAQDGLLTSIAQSVRLRGGPGTEWALLGTLEAGTPFRLDGRAPGGGWVRGIAPDGKIGWVIETSISASAEQIAALPSVWVETPFTLSAPGGGSAPAPAAEQPAAATPAPASPAAAVSQPQAVASGEGVVVTAVNQVRMRTLPSTEGQVILTITTGTKITASGRNPAQDWLLVKLPDGKIGWVSVQFTDITFDQLKQLPVTDGAAPTGAAAPPAAAAAAAAAPVEAVVNVPPVRGFSYGGHIQGFGGGTVAAMRQAGMTWAKKQYRYRQGASGDGLSGMINEAHANGFRILIGIVGSPGEVNNPGYFEAYAGFVGAVAAQGADAIEIWNEQNIDREWPTGSIDPGRYTELLRLSYNAIKAANPNTLVISGAPAPTGFFGGCAAQGCDDNAYLAGMARAGAGRYMDCVGAHYNEGIVSPTQTSGDPRGNSGYYTRYFYGMLNTYYGAFGKPVCWTELGYLTPEGFPPLPGAFGWAENVTVAQQASWLDQAVSLSAQSGKVRLLIIWNVDFTNYGDDPMGGYAIIRPGGGCPACEALGR